MARKTTRSDPKASDKPDNQAVFINNYPAALCHERTSTNVFTSVAFKLNDKWASFALANTMLRQSNRHNGQPIPNCLNLFLGKSDEMRSVSIQDGNGGYENIKMSNADILNIIQSNRAAYKAAHT